MRIELADHLAAHLPRQGTFDAVLSLTGRVFREHKNRRTFRCEIGGRAYFVKVHDRTPPAEFVRNLLHVRWPITSAAPERDAIERLVRLGAPTVRCAGFGERGGTPWTRQSFIITEALEGFIHLDEAVRSWQSLPHQRQSRLKHAAVAELAAIARAMHENGLNHRDFYLCHFMLPQRDFSTFERGDELRLHVIDLHRVQIRPRVPIRWIAKDLSGLLFSSLDLGVTSLDGLRFLRTYWGCGWRERLRQRGTRGFLRHVIRRAVRTYRGDFGRSPALPAGLASF